ncbi:MAG: AbrB/MazE/SpoVT family DNA-binding domain-containing protein [Fibrobacteria bacterium]|nr:AbrB/MazE/SpoVT family DNA-binding domain-containing protein [Fibrobacteria bacterium]
MYQMDITSLSSKGQVVIPTDIRKKMGLSIGAKLMVFCDGNNLFLKPILNPDLKVFRKMASESRKYAKKVGLKKADIGKAIKKVRNANRT